jgi:hypothetical protein
VLRNVRQQGNMPVIVLTGLQEEADRIVGLELGADDYVVKPFSPRELVARIRTVLRRTRGTPPPTVLVFDDLQVDMTSREVRVDGHPVALRRREFDLLAFLCASPRQVFTREQLLLNVWASEPEWQTSATVSEWDCSFTTTTVRLSRATSMSTGPFSTSKDCACNVVRSAGRIETERDPVREDVEQAGDGAERSVLEPIAERRATVSGGRRCRRVNAQ